MSKPSTFSRKKAIMLAVCLGMTLILGGYLVRGFYVGWERMVEMDCAHQLSCLGIYCREYAEKHHGRFPSRWSDLGLEATNGNWQRGFVCPRSGHSPGGWSNIDSWADYRLVPELTTNSPANQILAVEPAGNHRPKRALVLFVDGSVEMRGVESLGLFEESK